MRTVIAEKLVIANICKSVNCSYGCECDLETWIIFIFKICMGIVMYNLLYIQLVVSV